MKRLLVEALRAILRGVFNLLFRVEVSGLEHYENAGKRVLIIANHISFLDGILLGLYLPRMPLFVVNTYIARHWWAKPILSLCRYVTIDPVNPLYVKTLIRTLEADEAVAIFPEGRITVNGSLMKVYQGPGLVADKTGARILPVRLDGPQYSVFSRLSGVVRRRWLPKIRIVVEPSRTIDIPAEIHGHARRIKAGHQLEDIMREMMFMTSNYRQTLWQAMLDARSKHGGEQIIVEDINRRPLSYDQLIRASFALSHALAKPLRDQRSIGLMLPNTIGTVASFLALHLLGKSPAMLNYTMGLKGMRSAIRTASIGVVLTSREFIEVGGLEETVAELEKVAKVVYLEDIKQHIGLGGRLYALIAGLMPRTFWQLSKASRDANDSAVILFTSGSEGEPKGVVLSHINLLANREQIASVINFTPQDRMLNALPLFHSFGLTAGMMLPLVSGIPFFLYPSPLHYHIVPELAYDIRATVLFGTNTFLAGYARKAHPYDFFNMRYVVAGAEKLQEETRRTWQDKFGIRIFEGYGATETSPVLAVNTPLHYLGGSVGRLLPGVDYYLQPVPGIEAGGQLVVRGPNIMLGYLLPDNPGVLQPPHTERGDGWYDTGDIVTVDELGFVHIAGRTKRFAKLGGEMVSLTQVEQMAKECWPEDDHLCVSIPDAKKGEQLVLLTTRSDPRRAELLDVVRESGGSELLVPRQMMTVEKPPLLGSGKADYPAATKMALAAFG